MFSQKCLLCLIDVTLKALLTLILRGHLYRILMILVLIMHTSNYNSEFIQFRILNTRKFYSKTGKIHVIFSKFSRNILAIEYRIVEKTVRFKKNPF